jgi:hypothetical protein
MFGDVTLLKEALLQEILSPPEKKKIAQLDYVLESRRKIFGTSLCETLS